MTREQELIWLGQQEYNKCHFERAKALWAEARSLREADDALAPAASSASGGYTTRATFEARIVASGINNPDVTFRDITCVRCLKNRTCFTNFWPYNTFGFCFQAPSNSGFLPELHPERRFT